jgi:hypothetical protein
MFPLFKEQDTFKGGKGRYGIFSVITGTVGTELVFILISVVPDPWCFDTDPDPRNTGPKVQVQLLVPVVG